MGYDRLSKEDGLMRRVMMFSFLVICLYQVSASAAGRQSLFLVALTH